MMLPDSLSEEKLKIDWKMEDLQAGPFWFCSVIVSNLHRNSPSCRASIFQLIFNFSSEMESDMRQYLAYLSHLKVPVTKFKNSITLISIIAIIYSKHSLLKWEFFSLTQQELQSINDVSYLRQTLAVEKDDQEALEYFQNVFNDAYKGAWTTKLDWFFHSVRHGVNWRQ